MPLYVGLDGTLTPSDTLYESMMLFARSSPLNLLRLLAWLFLGKAGFKRRLAEAVRPDPARLPYHGDFLRFLRGEHARGRPLELASAADARIVREVAEHIGVFSATLGTEDGPNLSRKRKRERIAAHALAAGHTQWAYAGNSADDLAVWQGSALAVAVNTPVAVGMLVTRHPLHRSARALLTHTAPILSVYRQIVCLAKDAQPWVVAARLARTDRSAPTRDGSAGCGAVTPSSIAFQVPCESGSP
jgi:hypothetical protein